MRTKWKAKPKQQKPLRGRVEAKFLRFMKSFAVPEYREVRTILRELLANAHNETPANTHAPAIHEIHDLTTTRQKGGYT